jgi:hypothetical protein
MQSDVRASIIQPDVAFAQCRDVLTGCKSRNKMWSLCVFAVARSARAGWWRSRVKAEGWFLAALPGLVGSKTLRLAGADAESYAPLARRAVPIAPALVLIRSGLAHSFRTGRARHAVAEPTCAGRVTEAAACSRRERARRLHLARAGLADGAHSHGRHRSARRAGRTRHAERRAQRGLAGNVGRHPIVHGPALAARKPLAQPAVTVDGAARILRDFANIEGLAAIDDTPRRDVGIVAGGAGRTNHGHGTGRYPEGVHVNAVHTGEGVELGHPAGIAAPLAPAHTLPAAAACAPVDPAIFGSCASSGPPAGTGSRGAAGSASTGRSGATASAPGSASAALSRGATSCTAPRAAAARSSCTAPRTTATRSAFASLPAGVPAPSCASGISADIDLSAVGLGASRTGSGIATTGVRIARAKDASPAT